MFCFKGTRGGGAWSTRLSGPLAYHVRYISNYNKLKVKLLYYYYKSPITRHPR